MTTNVSPAPQSLNDALSHSFSLPVHIPDPAPVDSAPIQPSQTLDDFIASLPDLVDPPVQPATQPLGDDNSNDNVGVDSDDELMESLQNLLAEETSPTHKRLQKKYD